MAPGGDVEDRPAADDAVGPDLGRQQTRGSALLLVGRVGSMLLTITTQVVLVRALSKTEYGAFALALALASGCRVLLSLGQGRSLSRHLAVHDEAGDPGRLFGSLAVTLTTVVAVSAVVVTPLVLAGEAIGRTFLDSTAAAGVVVVLLLLAPLEALDEVLLSLFAVFARSRAIFFRRYLLTPGLRLVSVVAVALTSGDPVHIAIGYVAASVLGAVLSVTLVRGVLRERGLLQHLRLRGLVLPWREQLSFSVPLLSNELTALWMGTGTVLLLAYVGSAVDVADYRAVFPAARLNQFVYMVFATLYLPMAARYVARGAVDRLREEHWRTALLLTVLTFPVCAMTVAFAPVTTTTLLGEQYAAAAPVLVLLSLGYYVNSCLGFNVLALQVFSRVRWVLGANVVALLVNLALCLALVGPYGPVGIAVANAAMLVLQNVLYQWAVRRHLATAFVDRSVLPGYAAVAVGLGLLVAAQLLLEPGIVVALLLGAAVSLALLVGTRGALRLDESFPELRRVPVVRTLALPRPGRRR